MVLPGLLVIYAVLSAGLAVVQTERAISSLPAARAMVDAPVCGPGRKHCLHPVPGEVRYQGGLGRWGRGTWTFWPGNGGGPSVEGNVVPGFLLSRGDSVDGLFFAGDLVAFEIPNGSMAETTEFGYRRVAGSLAQGVLALGVACLFAGMAIVRRRSGQGWWRVRRWTVYPASVWHWLAWTLTVPAAALTIAISYVASWWILAVVLAAGLAIGVSLAHAWQTTRRPT